ncbi:hypothetical protein PIB30_001922 [Stylosanthes scabra]|uniref:Uncharacterized protein n=1 Tax=Stylosanthes scabra TaxID=79078 RepID=A0ABU6X1C7_9FABA|nr:hypothetical protein [Stylosanthes scabra]
MAQLLSPVYAAEALKIQNLSSSSRSSWRLLSNKVTTSCNFVTTPLCGGGKRRGGGGGGGRVRVAAEDSVSPNATPSQIKKAYYDCMKACHPDLSGNDPETTNFCMFINEVYEVLSDPVQRKVYDEIHGYSLTSINPFVDDSSPKDHAFVDEFSCIGCKNCTHVAPDVFAIEEDFGRARVYSQCGDPEIVQQAIDSCPVDCIHWTSAAQLSLLEDEMRRIERVNASSRWEKRQSKGLELAKMRMMKQQRSDRTDSYWDNLWGNPKDYESSEEEVKERAKRAAAAARRWREYSRKGADKPPTFKLPEASSGKDN